MLYTISLEIMRWMHKMPFWPKNREETENNLRIVDSTFKLHGADIEKKEFGDSCNGNSAIANSSIIIPTGQVHLSPKLSSIRKISTASQTNVERNRNLTKRCDASTSTSDLSNSHIKATWPESKSIYKANRPTSFNEQLCRIGDKRDSTISISPDFSRNTIVRTSNLLIDNSPPHDEICSKNFMQKKQLSNSSHNFQQDYNRSFKYTQRSKTMENLDEDVPFSSKLSSTSSKNIFPSGAVFQKQQTHYNKAVNYLCSLEDTTVDLPDCKIDSKNVSQETLYKPRCQNCGLTGHSILRCNRMSRVDRLYNVGMLGERVQLLHRERNYLRQQNNSLPRCANCGLRGHNEADCSKMTASTKDILSSLPQHRRSMSAIPMSSTQISTRRGLRSDGGIGSSTNLRSYYYSNIPDQKSTFSNYKPMDARSRISPSDLDISDFESNSRSNQKRDNDRPQQNNPLDYPINHGRPNRFSNKDISEIDEKDSGIGYGGSAQSGLDLSSSPIPENPVESSPSKKDRNATARSLSNIIEVSSKHEQLTETQEKPHHNKKPHFRNLILSPLSKMMKKRQKSGEASPKSKKNQPAENCS